MSSKDIAYIQKEKKVIQKLKKLKISNIEKDFAKLQSSYQNSSILQIIERYLLLISPYGYYSNNHKIQTKQIHETVNKLDAIILNISLKK